MKFAILGLVLIALIAFRILVGLCFAGYCYFYKQNNPVITSGSEDPGREQIPENSLNPSYVVQADVEVKPSAPLQCYIVRTDVEVL